jgi:hypothetical protein
MIKMKTALLSLLLSLSYFATAQTFTEVMNTPFDGVSPGSIAFSDVNGDGHEDLLITGLTSSADLIAKLYINDGSGHFTERINTPFDGVTLSSIAFSDVNGDGHEDLLITGYDRFFTSQLSRSSKLYINDGTGHFTEKTGTPFNDVSSGSIGFSDVNGDGHDDVLITGFSDSRLIAKLYINDGTGHFTEKLDTPFKGVWQSSVAFSDVNSDGYEDVLITGQSGSSGRIAKLYTNDGFGNFTERMDTPFDGVYRSSIAFSDVNGDGHEDLLIAGLSDSDKQTTKLYINDGAGSFTEKICVPFDGITSGSIAFSDVNGDGHEDLLIAGRSSSGKPSIAKLYINDWTGNFSEKTGTSFYPVLSSSIAFSDVNSDGREDVIITGAIGLERIAKLYINDGVSNPMEDFMSEVDLELTPYPNPTSSNRVNVSFNSKQLGFATLNLFDVKGHLLLQQKEFTGVGKQTLCIDITSLSVGSYFIQLDAGNRKGTATLVVQ